MPWNKTKNTYVNWLANTELKKFFSENILYKKDLSLWWLTKLIDRDFINDQDWYINLNKIFEKKAVSRKNFITFKVLVKFIISLISKVFFYFFYKILLKDSSKKNFYKNGIYVTFSNLSKYKNFIIDKQLGKFGLDQKSKIIYFVNLNEDFDSILNILKIKKKLKKIPYDYIIINNKINPLIILNIYFSILIKGLILKRELEKKNYFILDNFDCSKVLSSYLVSSFLGSIQRQILIGERIFEVLKKVRCKNFLTYMEFFPTSRSIYYFVNKSKIKNIISINHGNTSDNDLFFCFKKKEFSKSTDFRNFSPRPNYFTTKGNMYYKKLSKIFLPSQIYLTGTFKIELEKNFNKARGYNSNKNKKLYLICGLNDYKPFIYLLNQINLKKYKVYLLPHPVARSTTTKYFKKYSKFSFEIKNLSNKSSFFKKDDLIIFGDSSIGLELAYNNYNIIRLYHKKFIPTFDLEKSIPVATNLNKVSLFLKGKKIHKNSKKIEKNFFHKFDVKASKRLNFMLKAID